MQSARVQSAKLAEVDLRILKLLYEAEPDFTNLSAAEVIEIPIEFIGNIDVKIRLANLKSLSEIEGLFADYGLAMARLSPLMRQRLEDPAPLLIEHEGENWIERIRWLLSAPRAPSDWIRARDAVLARPKNIRRALARGTEEGEEGMTEPQTPEDEVAEIKLRIVLKLYDASKAIRLRAVDVVRKGADAQRVQVAGACIVELSQSMMDETSETSRERVYHTLRAAPRACLDGVATDDGRADPARIKRADRIRHVLAEADEGRFVRGECSALWHDAWTCW